MKFDLEYTFSEEVATINPSSLLLNYLRVQLLYDTFWRLKNYILKKSVLYTWVVFFFSFHVSSKDFFFSKSIP